MNLIELQDAIKRFERERAWDKFPESLIYIHLIEEITEIGRFILEKEGYKVSKLGHAPVKIEELESEFAQAFTLFIQLANRFNINLQKSLEKELEKMEERFPKEEWRRYLNYRTMSSTGGDGNLQV